MKMMYSALNVLFVAIITLSSCVKHDSIYKEQEHTADLDVPDGFDWSGSHAVSFSITSPTETMASFYCAEPCTPENQIGVLPVSEGRDTYTFDLPYSQKSVFIQYTTTDGITRTVKSDIKQGITKSSAVETDNIIFTEPSPNMSNLSMNIPNSGGYGTILFEDTWPDTGDYDFNDMVVNYKIKCSIDLSHSNHDIWVDVSLKIRALGGHLPYDFAMQMGTWTSGAIDFRIPATDMVGVSVIEKSNNDIDVQALNTEHPAIVVTGLNSLRKGEDYYNTVKKEDEGVQIKFRVTIKGTDDVQLLRIKGFADPKAFDYFIRHENGREIHMMGFAPTSLYRELYDKDVADKGGKYYYQSAKGLVWGLKAPAEIGWPVEKVDITGVYTYFAKWVESGGQLIGANGYDPLLWYDFHTYENYIK